MSVGSAPLHTITSYHSEMSSISEGERQRAIQHVLEARNGRARVQHNARLAAELANLETTNIVLVRETSLETTRGRARK